MSNYQSPPSWWQLATVVRELCRIVKLWDAGKITHESAMHDVAETLKGVRHV